MHNSPNKKTLRLCDFASIFTLAHGLAIYYQHPVFTLSLSMCYPVLALNNFATHTQQN